MPAPSSLDLEGQLTAVLGDVHREIDISRSARIFCNRNLRMQSIELLGFDMDYTLALYHQEPLEQLSIELTLKKLIANCGYPADILALRYDSRYAIRGLVVDKKRGNIFKMDRHGHVGRVFHGKRALDHDERKEQYRHSRIQLSHSRYHWIDTLFGLPEAVMYITLVDYFDARGGGPDYEQMFTDIRNCIDEAHRDETLKTEIKANLSTYVREDPKLAETLHKLRSAGKKMFVLTNSLWDYTDAVMSYLLDGVRQAYPSWRNYFDVVIVGGRKPDFFTREQPFLAIDPESGEEKPGEVRTLVRDRVYRGGNIQAFENMTGVRGENVLYVGDHIYGDILRLRKSHMWRTAMVLQELDAENDTSVRLSEQIKDLGLLDRRRRNLESEIDYQVAMLKRLHKLIEGSADNGQSELGPRLEEARLQAKGTLDSLRDRSRLMAEEVRALEASIERAYNPYWGALFRESNENSRFGEQVSHYADLYTSRVSNFLYYSPLRYFRAPRTQMPHEL